MYIAVALAIVVIIVFILLGFFGLKTKSPAPAAAAAPALSGPQELLQELSQQGGVTELKAYQITPGTGTPAKAGDTITVDYIGELPNGTVFDASQSHGKPFPFTLGVGQVIKGWDQALMGATAGEELLIAIPPSLGYGANAVGTIPANSTLIFRVKVISIAPAK